MIVTTASQMCDRHTCGAAGEKEECFRASAVGSFRSPPMCSLKLCTSTPVTLRRCAEPATSPQFASDATRPGGDVAGLQLDRRWFGLGLGQKLTGRGRARRANGDEAAPDAFAVPSAPTYPRRLNSAGVRRLSHGPS